MGGCQTSQTIAIMSMLRHSMSWRNSRRRLIFARNALRSMTKAGLGRARRMRLVRRCSLFGESKKRKPDFVPSRLFIYWNERNMEHSVPVDNGAQIRDGIKVVAKLGVCAETMWAYDDTPADPNNSLWPQGALPTVKPPKMCYLAAGKNQAIAYQRISANLSQMKGCLSSGYPFIIGFSVYESFEGPEVKKTGELNMLEPAEALVGGHAVLVVGYDGATTLPGAKFMGEELG